MNTSIKIKFRKLGLILCLLMFIVPVSQMEAQRFRKGGGSPNVSRSTPKRSVSRPSKTRSSRNMSRPSSPKRSINGGAIKSSNKKLPARSSSAKRQLKKSEIKRPNVNNSNVQNKISDRKKNININVDKSMDINIRNTRVRSSGRRYVRPPYIHGGFRFYAFRPYYYHPYRPYYWGPVWHPWGYFITSLATTAIIISIENQKYHYDQGVYYIQEDDGYRVVQAPVGAEIQELPEETQQVEVNETTNNYYYGGTYYEKDGEKYIVVPPTAGTIVPNLPVGGEEVRVGEQTFVQYGETYYQPVQVDGKDMYEVVEMQEEDS